MVNVKGIPMYQGLKVTDEERNTEGGIFPKDEGE